MVNYKYSFPPISGLLALIHCQCYHAAYTRPRLEVIKLPALNAFLRQFQILATWPLSRIKYIIMLCSKIHPHV